MRCTSNWESRSITGYRKNLVVPLGDNLPDTGIVAPFTPAMPPTINPVHVYTAHQIEQMRQADEQMAAYLATNPDPLTGLPQGEETRNGLTQAEWYALREREAQEQQRRLPERDHYYDNTNPYNEPEQDYYWDYYGYRGPYGY